MLGPQATVQQGPKWAARLPQCCWPVMPMLVLPTLFLSRLVSSRAAIPNFGGNSEVAGGPGLGGREVCGSREDMTLGGRRSRLAKAGGAKPGATQSPLRPPVASMPPSGSGTPAPPSTMTPPPDGGGRMCRRTHACLQLPAAPAVAEPLCIFGDAVAHLFDAGVTASSLLWGRLGAEHFWTRLQVPMDMPTRSEDTLGSFGVCVCVCRDSLVRPACLTIQVCCALPVLP